MTRPLSLLSIGIVLACSRPVEQHPAHHGFASDVVYHVFQRSFYDADGDQHGDLRGLTSKLDYLEDLGVTTILMVPIYPSIFYHNYFPTTFEGVDREYGSPEDYAQLVSALHERGMKLIMDMEIHYVTEQHAWWDSYGNPESEYSDYIIYNGPGNTDPESMIFGLSEMTSYTGEKLKVATANMLDEEVKAYHAGLFNYWMDPNGDGDFSDGVDGFRIDHMMDDLDGKGVLPNMFAEFWAPLFAELREVNADIVILAEQADWTLYGDSYFEAGGVDAVFGFPVREAILSNDKTRIEAAVTETLSRTPEGNYQLLFLENHDTDRYASLVEDDPARLRSGAALLALLYGVPSLYYGQEIGMRGRKAGYGWHDGNDIPVREAFEWYAEADGEGMTYWYRDSGPWWDDSRIRSHDGVSVEEQRGDQSALWSHYKALLSLRASKSALQSGRPQFVENDHDEVLMFLRSSSDSCVLVAVSLSAEEVTAKLTAHDLPDVCPLDGMAAMPEWSADGSLDEGITLGPGQVAVWEAH
jgi:glycosidase